MPLTSFRSPAISVIPRGRWFVKQKQKGHGREPMAFCTLSGCGSQLIGSCSGRKALGPRVLASRPRRS